MRRRPHYLKTSTSVDSPQQGIWFDTETELRLPDGTVIPLAEWKAMRLDSEFPKLDNKEVTQHLIFGQACYMRQHRDGKWTDEDWLRFTDPDQFWQWTESKLRKKVKLYLFCHNTAFDLPVLDIFHQLPHRGFTLRSAIIDAPPTILKFSRDGSTLVVLDTLNIYRCKLAFLGEKIGLDKLDMPDNNDVEGAWDTYTDRDVEIIREACIQWWQYLKDNDWGGFAPTLAGQALMTFRHKYLKHKIFIDCNERALQLTRGGYYGGRVECFKIGRYEGRFFSLDVNRMYPSVMEEFSYPVRLIGHTSYADMADLVAWLSSYSVCARVLLICDQPFAPVRTKDKLVFPVGEYEAILSTPELQYAFEHNYIVKVNEVAVYEHAPIFREMMRDLDKIILQAAETNNKFLYWHVKKFQNSLYGKTGQNGIKWQEAVWTDDLSCKQWIELDYDTGRVTRCRQLAGLIQYKETEGESRDSFPAIAAHVTAYARIKLWRLIQQAGLENVYYCDTDAIWTNETGMNNLLEHMHPTKLGALKVDKTADYIELYGAKDYKFGKTEKTKGVRKDAIWLDGWTVEQEQWAGLKGLIARDSIDAPRVKKIRKTLTRLYGKGQVMPDGSVLPFVLDRTTIEQQAQLRFDVHAPESDE